MKEQQNNFSARLKTIIAVLAIFLAGSQVYSFQITKGAKGVKTELGKTATEKELVINGSENLETKIEKVIRKEMAAKKIPALSIAVIKNNKVIMQSAYNLANIELNVPATLNTSYSLASMTKIFTASGIMLLVLN